MCYFELIPAKIYSNIELTMHFSVWLCAVFLQCGRSYKVYEAIFDIGAAGLPMILPKAVWGTSRTSVAGSQSVTRLSRTHLAIRICSGEPRSSKPTAV